MGRAHAALAAGTDDLSGPSVLRRWADVFLVLSARWLGLPYSAATFHACLNEIDPDLPPWLGRLFHAVGGPAKELLQHLEASRPEAMATENPWADLIFALLEGCSLVASSEGEQAVGWFDSAAAAAVSLEAPVLAAWASAAGSLGALLCGSADAVRRAVSSDELARSVGCPGASALALLVEAAARGDPNWTTAAGAVELEGVVPMVHLVSSLRLSSAPNGASGTSVFAQNASDRSRNGPVRAVDVTANPDDVAVQCFGPFAMNVAGHTVDGAVARPRVRALLHYLAMQAGGYVHRDALCSALWPNEDARAATRSLQVAVSALRQLIEAQAGPGAGSAIGRKGESYGLAVEETAHDLANFQTRVKRGRCARLGGDSEIAVSELRAAIAVYRGELLEDAGTAEWVLGPRERYRLMASQASQLLAASLIDVGEPTEAAAAAAWGLAVDRYCDELWKLMITAHDLGSNQAASARTRKDYRQVLAELGVSQEVS